MSMARFILQESCPDGVTVGVGAKEEDKMDMAVEIVASLGMNKSGVELLELYHSGFSNKHRCYDTNDELVTLGIVVVIEGCQFLNRGYDRYFENKVKEDDDVGDLDETTDEGEEQH
jgi:hypothetical protein